MNIDTTINHMMPFHGTFPDHTKTLEQAREIVKSHHETSCLFIKDNNSRYVFEEILCSNKTCIDRSINVFNSIREIIKNHRIPINGARFIYHFKGDACNLNTPFPLLANSRKIGNTNIILWPLLLKTHYLLTGIKYDRYLHDEVTKYLHAPDRLTWNQKEAIFLFRGMNSGNPFPSISYAWNMERESRCKLLLESLRLPDKLRHFVDVGFNKTYPDIKTLRQNHKNLRYLENTFSEHLREGHSIKTLQDDIQLVLSHVKPSLTRAQLYRYKYLLCPEGFDCASALSWVMASNSLAVAPPFHYENTVINSKALKPYVHFLPIREDYSDLADVIRWAQDHDDECQNMISNGNEYMQLFTSSYWMEKIQAEILRKLLN